MGRLGTMPGELMLCNQIGGDERTIPRRPSLLLLLLLSIYYQWSEWASSSSSSSSSSTSSSSASSPVLIRNAHSSASRPAGLPNLSLSLFGRPEGSKSNQADLLIHHLHRGRELIKYSSLVYYLPHYSIASI